MNLKDILVHLDNRHTCASRLEVAVRLAAQQQSSLTGLYVLVHPHDVPERKTRRQLATEARDAFEKAATDQGIKSQWLELDLQEIGLDLPQAVILHAHYHDLLVLSQSDYDSRERTIPANLPEKAVLGSGRPVLIVPYIGGGETLGKRVMLAWRGGPESSRAVHDSLPLLRRAEMIRVITIQGRGGDEIYQAHTSDICHHLRRYDLDPSSEKLNAGNLSVGDLLLNRCADQGIDLLVMGAFAQSRRGHQTLGEVGSHLLKSMTVPVLMSY
ncbi:MAG TPA: universal stress protein [Desulfuromonadales bacterium]|nr:universal stress protein [Desulfuromonadales bacterium]